jgi:vitamin B12 transporter
MKKTLFAASACALALTGGAFAQQAESEAATKLDRIVVSPNRTENEQGKVGSKVEVVTAEEIEAKARPVLSDYLNLLPGVSFTSNGGLGTQSGLFVRGLGSRYVKTLYNGIDISDPANTQVQTHYQYLLTGGVGSIEVLKGSQSTLYGSNAIAGLIDISTLGETENGVHHTLEAEGGSFGTVRGRYGLSASNNESRFSANVSGLHTDGISAADGFPERDGYDNVTMDAAVEHRISEAFSVFGSLLYIDTKAHYDDDGADNLFNEGDSKMSAARLGFNLDLMDGRLKNTFSVQGSEMDRQDTTEFFGTISNSSYVGKRQKFEYQGSFDLNDNILLQYGLDHEQQRAEVVAWTPVSGSYDLTGVWGQTVVSPIDNLVLTAGVRHDEHSEFGGHTTYRGTASYLFEELGTRLHSSIGTGFRAPSLAELYESPSGNPNLRPETSTSFDFGVEQTFLEGRIIADATYFQIDVDDQIVSRWPSLYEQISGTTRSRGLEASIAYAATDWLDIAGSYTYTDSRRESGERNFYVPRHAFVLSASIRPAEKWTVSADLKYVSDTVGVVFPPPSYAQTRIALDNYALLNAKVAYQLSESTEIYLRGENLLNENYQTVAGYGTPGISAFAGIKAKF